MRRFPDQLRRAVGPRVGTWAAMIGGSALLALVAVVIGTRKPSMPPPSPPSAAVREAPRPCYLPGDTGVAVLDTVATSPTAVVTAIAAPRDRATLSYVEARSTGASHGVCLGRVVLAATGWEAYVRTVEPKLGNVDRALVDSTGAGTTYTDRAAASSAVERAAAASGGARDPAPNVRATPRAAAAARHPARRARRP